MFIFPRSQQTDELHVCSDRTKKFRENLLAHILILNYELPSQLRDSEIYRMPRSTENKDLRKGK